MSSITISEHFSIANFLKCSQKVKGIQKKTVLDYLPVANFFFGTSLDFSSYAFQIWQSKKLFFEMVTDLTKRKGKNMKTVKRYNKYVPEIDMLTFSELLEIYVTMEAIVIRNTRNEIQHPDIYKNTPHYRHAKSALRKIANLMWYYS